MKYLLTFIIFSITLFKINASTVDSTLIKEYQRGYDTVYEIIEHENLKDCIALLPIHSVVYFMRICGQLLSKKRNHIYYTMGIELGMQK